MDKNYNVDDILSEIKGRKSRERSGATGERAAYSAPTPPAPRAAAPRPEPEPELRFAPPAKTAASETPRASRRAEADKAHFDFVLPQAEEKKSNPMEFSGHVRPITDKAKLRPNRLGAQSQRPAAGGFQFNFAPPDNIEAPPPPLDFSGFRPKDATQEHTRILPKVTTGREFDPEEIRKLDLGSPDEDYGEEGYYDEEEYLQDSAPGSTVIDFSEYNSASDRKAVATDIAKVKLWLFIRASVTLVLTFILVYLAFAGKHIELPLPPSILPEGSDTLRGYLLACTLGTVLVALVNSSAVGGGLISLFKMRANSDALVSLALLASIGQGAAACLKPEEVDPTQLSLYFSVAALSMLFNALGKMTMINRIQSNFRIIASDREKKALLAVDSDDFIHEFATGTGRRRPTVAYSAKAGFFTDFLALSYSDKYDVGINRAVAPVCLLGALVVGVSVYFLTESMASSIATFTAILCVCATFSATFIENIPLGKLTKKLAPQGGMVSGNKAVEDFCDTSALILSENDLFPQGNVQLHGIKAFSQGRIDEAILDAASVLCAVDGALSHVFLQMIGGNRKLLKKVDNIVYENNMGLSAWVDGRRVLIGNRQLMLNHGIALPPESVEKQLLAQGEGEPLYLSNSGEASARFVVSYHIDDELATQLDLLAAKEKTLIIHTTDANITPHKLWELYGYPEELIRILPAERHTQYRTMTVTKETAIAEIVYTGRASTLVKAILACISARSSILSATVIQLMQIVVGYGLVAFMAFMGAISSLSVTQLCVYQSFWFLAIFIMQKSRQS